MFKQIRYLRWHHWGRWWIKNRINSKARRGEKIKIIIGSGKDFHEKDNWIYTDLPHFDITQEKDWSFFFSKNIIDNLLAEHVLEHISTNEVKYTLESAYKYLKKGGIFRIAVPDAFNPDPNYLEINKPPQFGHQDFWDYHSLSLIAEKNNFSIRLLEYFDKQGKLHKLPFTNENGHITRTSRNNIQRDSNNFSSLIIDLIKQ